MASLTQATETQRKGPLELNAKCYAAFCVSAVSLCPCFPGGEKSFKHANGPADLLGRCHTGHIRVTFLFTKQLIEAAQRVRFVLVNIEHCEQLSDHQQVLNLISEIQ